MSLLDLSTFTALHIIVSLVALGAGIPLVLALAKGRRVPVLTEAYFILSLATTLSGYGFPFIRLLPSHVVGALSLVALGAALYALYGARLAGRWAWIYPAATVTSVYFIAFVAVVQAFLKLPDVAVLAPTQTEPPFLAAQLAVLLAFLALGWLAVRARAPAAAVP